MRTFKKYFWALCMMLGIWAGAQEKGSSGIPKETYYLMPEFAQGTIYFIGQGPAEGKLNICAVDNTLRFLDKSGKEVVAAGVLHELETDKHYPYEVSETLFLYKGDTVFPLNKKNLKKLFPKKKSEIDAWFKAGNRLPETVPDSVALLAQFNTKE